MDKQPILSVSSLGKCYKDFGSERRRVLSWFTKRVQPLSEHWTLSDISFDVFPGDAIGILGHNGAGKSTLLKLITGTLGASSGSVTCHGRVSAILELGMGFHPDFTGRENAYHSAGMMGFSKEEVDTVISDIEAFAEIGEYFDQSVRTYSSGMQVRVAFAVATAFQPEILIIDEALSVGDAYFQHKSFSRIREFLETGTSLIIVSHDVSAIMSICNKALLLEHGSLIAEGDPENVINVYSALTAEHEAEHEKQAELTNTANSETKESVRSGNGKAVIKNWNLLNAETRQPTESFVVGENALLEVVCSAETNVERLGLGIMIRDRFGLPVFGTNSFLQKSEVHNPAPNQSLVFEVNIPLLLGKGNYSITMALEDQNSQRLDWIDLAVVFEVRHSGVETFIGTTCLPVEMSVTTREAD